ncbi:N-methyl-L-tryptophan oxidase [Microvirga terricola]|uniref:N-methyl-L-tryptophan oxidase n=1 Tax=Microvirga terricola TaxID=2719797 RepID=A0ABX0V659_9HYPH|nr:N-methyl-L-tryptophan oxidase [Microvirga terricola]NIX75063.1 N-methyl-L-tryptophan oxidase [Microvirga terricola]
MSKPLASCDVAVIGLGAMGSAAIYQLAKRGVKAIGIDRHSPPHDRGSTHGETRITRQAIGEGEAYVPLALRSNEIWRELEAETGRHLLTQNGCLIIGTEQTGSEGVIRAGFLNRTRRAAEHYRIPHEILNAAEIRRRFPQFAPQEQESGYFEPSGGYLNPEGCVAAQLERAEALGAALRRGTTVLSVRQEGDAVRIKTDQGDILAGEAILSAGAWAAGLLNAPFDKLFAPSRQVMHWFPVAANASQWEESPVFIWSHGPNPNDFFYGFPSLPGSGAIKTAGEQYEDRTDPDNVERNIGPTESREMYDQHVAGRLEGLIPSAVKAVTCLYTITPDSNFVIDRHPDANRILVVSPCSGHGFKHSAAIGEVAAQIVTDGQSRIDLSAFSLARFQSLGLL